MIITLLLCLFSAGAFGATYYKVGGDPGNGSSFYGNYTQPSCRWSTTQGATTTSTFSADDFAAASCIIDDADKYLRTPASGSFGGNSLTLTTGGRIVFAGTVTVGDLRIADEGTLTSWTANSSYALSGKLTLDENAVLTYYAGYASETVSGDRRNLEIRSTLAGPASSKISIAGAAGKNTMQSSMLQISDASGFLGTIEAAPDEGLHDFALAITGPFGGSITSLPVGTKAVSVNYDGLPAETGLRVATATPDATVRTGIVLYSANRDFAAKKLPLLTFPSSPNIRAKDFTVRHATEAGGTATAFEKLQFRSNEDGSCTLMANSSGGMALILK